MTFSPKIRFAEPTQEALSDNFMANIDGSCVAYSHYLYVVGRKTTYTQGR